MNKRMIKKGIAVGVLLLFFGSILLPPGTALVQQKNMSPSLNATSDQPITSENAVYKLLIISPSEFVDELQPLVQHKGSIGVATRLVSLSEV